MTEVRVVAQVPAPPERAWAAVADLSRFPEWLTLHEAWRGAPPAGLAAGARFTSVVRVRGLRNRITWRLDTYDPPASLAITGKGVGGLHVSLAVAVRPNRRGSSVSLAAEITGPPTIGLFGLVIGRAVRAELDRSAAALAALLTTCSPPDVEDQQ
ncbi:MAG: SRPBCC family protein [Labedaea sp.]